MKILFYHSSVLLDHHMGVLLDEAKDLCLRGHEIYFTYCNQTLTTCISNPKGELGICQSCKSRTEHALKLLPKNCTIIKLNKYKTKEIKKEFKYKSISDIKKIDYNGTKIGLGAVSSYITITRNNEPIIDKEFTTYFDYILNDLCGLTQALDACLKDIKPDLVCIFNGRLGEDRPMFDLCINNNINIRCYEVIGGINEEYYKIYFNNNMPHNINASLDFINNLWNSSHLTEKEKYEIGKSFYIKRRKGIPTNDKVYINNQTKGLLPEEWNPNIINIAIFNTSEDEYTSIGDDYDKLQIFPSQLEGIKKVLELTKENKNIHYYLRIHPNLANLTYAYHTELYKLPQKFQNITIIPATSAISTYDLMENANKIIVFGSTMGLESSFWQKPVILLAAAFYYSNNICYIPKNLEELRHFLIDNIPAKQNIETIKWGFYFMYRNSNDKFKYINFNKTTIKIKNKIITLPHYQKLLGSSKLYTLCSLVKKRIFYSSKSIFKQIPIKGI